VKLHKKRLWQSIFLVLPALVWMSVFFLLPMLQALGFSFTDWNGYSSDLSFVGLSNYTYVFADPAVKQVLLNTFFLTILYVPALNALALLFAILVKNSGSIGKFYRLIFFFPNMLSMTVVAFIWRIIFAYDGGLLNSILLKIFGDIRLVDWLGNNATVMPAMSMVIIWFAIGYYTLIYIAGLETISQEIYEAAAVDGVPAHIRLWRITIPLMIPSIAINVILSMIGILSLFDIPFVLTKGGPGYSSQTLALHIYYYAFPSQRIDYALALAMVLGVIAVLAALIQLIYFRAKEHAYVETR
jgi:ABC-type sugar transport system permease subunit